MKKYLWKLQKVLPMNKKKIYFLITNMPEKINLIYWIIFCISLTALIIGSIAFSKISSIRQPSTVPADTGDPSGICSGRQDAFAASGMGGNPAQWNQCKCFSTSGTSSMGPWCWDNEGPIDWKSVGGLTEANCIAQLKPFAGAGARTAWCDAPTFGKWGGACADSDGNCQNGPCAHDGDSPNYVCCNPTVDVYGGYTQGDDCQSNPFSDDWCKMDVGQPCNHNCQCVNDCTGNICAGA
jgi:hypothetical protein